MDDGAAQNAALGLGTGAFGWPAYMPTREAQPKLTKLQRPAFEPAIPRTPRRSLEDGQRDSMASDVLPSAPQTIRLI